MAVDAPESVAEYIAGAPAAVRPMLQDLRATIRAAAPEAEERISYGMPYYHLHGRLAYFRLHTKHIGLYPAGLDEATAVGLEGNMAAKATLQFPLDQPLPLSAIRTLIERRVAAIEATAGDRGPRKRRPARS